MSNIITQKLLKQVSEDNNLERSESEFALKYLEYYYIESKTKALAQSDLSEHVRQFQKNFGLEVNGKLDIQTIRAMHYPRCGCPDYQSASGPESSRWGIKKLTYFVEKYVNNISKADQDNILDLAFQQWEEHCELDITRVTAAAGANMILSTGSGRGDNFDGPSGTLAWAYLPPGNSYNGQLLMRFDLGETWVANAADRGILLLNVACHEFGHFLGLSHSSQQRALMAPYYTAAITKPQAADDIPRIQGLYGKRVTPPTTTPAIPPTTTPAIPPTTTPAIPPTTPTVGNHKVEITGINLDQVKIDGKNLTDFSLI